MSRWRTYGYTSRLILLQQSTKRQMSPVSILPGRGVIELQAWCFQGAERQLKKIRLDVVGYRLFCPVESVRLMLLLLKKHLCRKETLIKRKWTDLPWEVKEHWGEGIKRVKSTAPYYPRRLCTCIGSITSHSYYNQDLESAGNVSFSDVVCNICPDVTNRLMQRFDMHELL